MQLILVQSTVARKPLGLIVHGLCFLGVNVFAIECILGKWIICRFGKLKARELLSQNKLTGGQFFFFFQKEALVRIWRVNYFEQTEQTVNKKELK